MSIEKDVYFQKNSSSKKCQNRKKLHCKMETIKVP